MGKRVNNYRATAVLVRAFFEAFGKGVVDAQPHLHGAGEQENPKEMKQLMLDRYEDVFDCFFNVMITALVRLNYPNAEMALTKLQHDHQGGAATKMDVLKFVCKLPKLYEAMVTEYKRNFTLLLQGKTSTMDEHLASYSHGSMLSVADEPLAINILVRLIIQTYFMGLKKGVKQGAGKGTSTISPNQTSIYRMMLMNTQLLINDAPFQSDSDDMERLFHEACGNKDENFNVLFNTMQETMQLLVNE